jgi:hypothetical protein
MAGFSDKDLDGTRAVLAPTLDATAAILPWVAKPQPVRFSPELNKRWEAGCKDLSDSWLKREGHGVAAVRTAIFALLAVAIETHDVDCLHLAEGMASAAEKLDEEPIPARVAAALTATCEALLDEGGLENPHFVGRARHFAQRLEASLAPSRKPGVRSDVLDNLFVSDTRERLERMYDALAVLPIDVVELQIEAQEMIQQAEQIEMWGIYHMARQLESFVVQLGDASEEVQDRARSDIDNLLHTISGALNAVDG